LGDGGFAGTRSAGDGDNQGGCLSIHEVIINEAVRNDRLT
jgi:hypothetical protein